MNYCKELKSGLESLFSMSFEVESNNMENEVVYTCFPSNEGETLFKVNIRIHNGIRVIAEISPQKHGGELLYELECATPEKVALFFEYQKVIQGLGAKIQFLVNNTIISSPKDWKKHWRQFYCRLTKVPLTDDNDEYSEEEVLLKWAKHCFCWIFSALTITDSHECNLVCESSAVVGYGKLEGTRYEVTTNRYERSTINRELCLAQKGYICKVCGFDFRKKYGVIGKEYIEVHHIVPVSQLGPNYKINIEKDLIPVCSNCHAMLHRKNPPYLPSEMKEIILKKSHAIATDSKKGVLMVMMENYESKSTKFLINGKLAIGIKWTNDSMEIVQNIDHIGYVLFHHRNDADQHLFAVKGSCKVVRSEELESDRYCNVKEKDMYVSVDLDVTIELDASVIKSSSKHYTKETRYDAQYNIIKD